jgi:hypothetical protein
MSDWGPKKYGDPCSECGYAWTITLAESLTLLKSIPGRFREAVDGHDATAHHPDLAWSASAYVAHVGDNLRIFAERIAALDLGAYGDNVPYSPDLLAEARQYDLIPIQGALWSLDHAVADIVEAVERSEGKEVAMVIDDRGPQNLTDILRTTTHDAFHHVWDVQRIITSASDSAKA